MTRAQPLHRCQTCFLTDCRLRPHLWFYHAAVGWKGDLTQSNTPVRAVLTEEVLNDV